LTRLLDTIYCPRGTSKQYFAEETISQNPSSGSPQGAKAKNHQIKLAGPTLIRTASVILRGKPALYGHGSTRMYLVHLSKALFNDNSGKKLPFLRSS